MATDRKAAAGTWARRGAMSLILVALSGCGGGLGRSERERQPVPVEVAAVESGPMTQRRSLSGTLVADASFVVGSRISGQVKELRVRISDALRNGDTLAVLDEEPYLQEVRRAEADLLVTKANLADARAQAEIAERGMDRYRKLSDSGFVSDTQYDEALTQVLSAEAQLEVAQAQVTRAEAILQSVRIQLQYTQVRAAWSGDDSARYVAERFVDEGDVVGTNDPMFRVVDLDPLLATVYVTEADYPNVHVGDPVEVRTDAYPGVTFSGEVIRIAPVFSATSRQALVELLLANPDLRLKPGMFIRADLTLERHENVLNIPQLAIIRRDNHNGIFLVDGGGETVRWVEVETGILEGDRVEILSPEIAGRVVILGQQLLEDGTSITITNDTPGDPQ